MRAAGVRLVSGVVESLQLPEPRKLRATTRRTVSFSVRAESYSCDAPGLAAVMPRDQVAEPKLERVPLLRGPPDGVRIRLAPQAAAGVR
jgi:hypothetical protein